MKIKNIKLFFYCLLVLLFLQGCENQSLPKGTVALVNGEPVSLRSVQALMDSRSASLGLSLHPSLGEMRSNYRQAAAILIVNALARQELKETGMEIGEKELEQAINSIESDFGDESLEGYLADASLREEDWRQFMKDTLALEAFTTKILLPSIHVSLDEIRAYYDAHKQEFARPAQIRICYAATEEKDGVAKWCESENEETFSDSPLAQCASILPEEMPDPWKEDLRRMKPLSCGKIVQDNGQWRTIALLKKLPPSEAPLSEVYPLIENMLLDQKKSKAFAEWLEKKLAASKILAAPELFPNDENESEF